MARVWLEMPESLRSFVVIRELKATSSRISWKSTVQFAGAGADDRDGDVRILSVKPLQSLGHVGVLISLDYPYPEVSEEPV